ncbi:MAG TPA: MFS transporter [Chloroflexota bacterium]|nr:MFS transporter [Chloroflexota bacterium]
MRAYLILQRGRARPIEFWVWASLLGLLLGASGAASPLYRVYQAEWHFSATTLTAVFAVYALALLITLLLAGSLSDYLGRRPVIAVALALDAAATMLFLAAHGVGLLFAARALQGIAVGATAGALSAALIERQPAGTQLGPVVGSAAPIFGLGAGALASSALIQYGPAPTQLVWWLLLAAFVLGIAATLALSEPGTRRPGALGSLRSRVAVPRAVRGTFAAAVPCLVATWALSGLYLSLGPSLAAVLFGSQNRLWGGLVIGLLTASGGTAAILLRNSRPTSAMVTGCLLLLLGVGVTFGAIATTRTAAFLAGTAVAGAGFGAAFLGAFRTLVALAAPGERAGLIASVYVVSYLAFSVPALIAGVVVSQAGLRDTALVYAAAVAMLSAVAAASFLFRRAYRPPGQPSVQAEVAPQARCRGPAAERPQPPR